MSVKVEKQEGSMALLTIEIEADKLEEAINKAYQKEKGRISVPGFRKGKVARQVIEKMYGPEIFYDEASDILVRETIEDACTESGEEIVSTPSVEIVQIEKGKPFIYTASVALKPPVELGEYKGVVIDKVNTEVTEEDINEALEKERKNNARTVEVTDRNVEDGDTVLLDFEGYVDGVAFEGGKGSDHSLKIGSGSFIPGFEDQLIGAVIGEECEVNVKFPEDYHAEELAGKDAVFKCMVNKIEKEELPELDDEFASEVSEFETLDEYKADLKTKLEERKAKEAQDAKEEAAISAAVENAKIEIPGPMLEAQKERMIDEFAQQLMYQGMSFEQYSKFTGATRQQMMDQVEPQAETRIRTRLVLEAVAEAEKLEASDADYEDELKTMAEAYGREVDDIKKDITEEVEKMIKDDLKVRAAAKFLADNAKEK
ncbi:MAG: trigger factor [Lachnospiraceae bacterium]|nr:trigger factor [Lachnospiraceae bacterium]